MLQINQKLNPFLKIDVYDLAVTDKDGPVYFNSSLSGSIAQSKTGIQVEGVRLVPWLLRTYGREFVNNICMVKVDTEGQDLKILQSFPAWFRPPAHSVERCLLINSWESTLS